MVCTVAELNEMDLGTHMEVMQEWNEGTEFKWKDAMVFLHGYYTRVVHDDGIGGLHIATYVTGREGDLVSLRVFADVSTQAVSTNKVSSQLTQRALHRDHLIGTEYWWHEDKAIPSFKAS